MLNVAFSKYIVSKREMAIAISHFVIIAKTNFKASDKSILKE